MKTHRILLLCLFLFCTCVPATLQAQFRSDTPLRSAAAPYESDILSARPVRYVLGLGPGAMYYTHDGSFSPSCDCNFSDQSDTQFHFAGEFLVQYPKLGFAYGVLVTYYDVSAEFSREEVRPSIVVGDDPPIDVEYRNTSNVTLQWLSVTPEFLWYIPRSSAFLMAGLELGFPLDARYDHIEHILTPGITYYDGNTDNVLVEESDIPDGTRMRFAIALGLGYEIHLGPSVSITPHAGLNLPLTTVSSTDDSWRVTTAYGLLMLQLRL